MLYKYKKTKQIVKKEWAIMKPIEIIVIIVSALIVVGVIILSAIKKKQGNGCCDCSSCPHGGSCKMQNQNKNKNK